jgi:hypothetical protein
MAKVTLSSRSSRSDMGWFAQWASAISGESAANYRRREEAREAFDREEARKRAEESNRQARVGTRDQAATGRIDASRT